MDEGLPIGLYSAERCIVDAFRLRHQVGEEVAVEALRRWLRHVAVTYVATASDGDRILGFATVAAANVECTLLPSERLCRKLPAYPLPVLRLARLGVDEAAHGLGIGDQLLRHVLVLAAQQRDTLGCVGVVTDARPGAVAFYERFGFATLVGVREGGLRGDPTPMFLGMATIEAALHR